jgi:hypothetical protein
MVDLRFRCRCSRRGRGTGGQGQLVVQIIANPVSVDDEVVAGNLRRRPYPQGPAERSTAFRCPQAPGVRVDPRAPARKPTPGIGNDEEAPAVVAADDTDNRFRDHPEQKAGPFDRATPHAGASRVGPI